MRLLLAVDSVLTTEILMNAVASRPWPRGTRARDLCSGGAEVKVMSMVNPLIYSIEEIGLFDIGGTLRAHKAIGDAAHILNEAGLKTSAEVIVGRPCRRIINEARDWGTDLIVVGKHDRRGLMQLLEGSVSERVEGSAPCSVKFVREPELTLGR